MNVWAEMIHPADRDHAFSAFMEYIHSGSREVHEAEYRMRAQDGAWHWMLVKAIAVAWNPEGKSSRVLGLKLDIQEMKNAQKTSLASQDMARALLEQSSRFIGPAEHPRLVPDSYLPEFNSHLKKRGKIFYKLPKIHSAHRRSEERRVGKECRSRWSPYH